MRKYYSLRRYPDSNYQAKLIRKAKAWAWGVILVFILMLVWAGLGAPVSYGGESIKNYQYNEREK